MERERFLGPEEIERLAAALAGSADQRGASIVRLCLLTGALLGEVRTARFEQFHLDLGIWTTQTRTTLRYAHLADQPLRAGVNAVAALVKTRPRVRGIAYDLGGLSGAPCG